MKLASWNVNGLRACLKKGFTESVAELDVDFLCLQETKLGRDAPPELDLPRLAHRVFHNAEKPGYSGTAILSSKKPNSIETDLGDSKFAGEGRVIAAEFSDFYLVNSYVPNSQDGLRRLVYRCNKWEPRTRDYLLSLSQVKPVLYCGDLNVAHKEIDIARPQANRRNAGFTDEERQELTNLIEAGFIDTFRHFHPKATERYSWWSYRGGARQRNVGWRLDYFLASESAANHLVSADILDSVEGSDHCPVTLEIR
ncbi:MAG: exodeoxyribonuclease III [Verrucomicrobiota bacterium]